MNYETKPVNLLEGKQQLLEYTNTNPQGLVPTLEHEGNDYTQSLAICEYLDEIQPAPPILPARSNERAVVRGMAQQIACDIHPVNNLRVLKYLTGELSVSESQKEEWYRHWVKTGLDALEKFMTKKQSNGRFCFGDTPTLADICLVPQLYNARRFQVDLAAYPSLLEIEKNCHSLDAFRKAHPDNVI